MNLHKLRVRTWALISILLVCLLVFSGTLINYQLVRGAEFRQRISNTTSTVPLAAARGLILDRNGLPLVTNRQCLALLFEQPFFPSAKQLTERNQILAALLKLCVQNKTTWIDDLPITLDANHQAAFVSGREDEIAEMKGKNYLNLNSYATAQNCLDALIATYALQAYSLPTARNLASIHYNMWKMQFSMHTPYQFTKGVSKALVAQIQENSVLYRGVKAEVLPERAYTSGTLAPHVLGRVANINKTDYEAHKAEGYSITDAYGAFGIERAAEAILRGQAGEKTITLQEDGQIREDIRKPARQGNTVILSMDSQLQALIETNFPKHLAELSDKRYSQVPMAGAVVVMDVKTFEVLASVSYPSYNIAEYQTQFAAYSTDSTKPLWNRVLQGTYEPGSTSKVSIALAALQERIITPSFQLRCTGIYPYLDQTFHCPQVRLHHGNPVNVHRGLVDSCNSFFYDMGRQLGYEKINAYRMGMGLGQKTGVELPEQAGVIDSPEQREKTGQIWYKGYNLQSAIGQGNLFTPMQLAVYACTIANGGERLRARYIQSVRRAGSNELVEEYASASLGKTGIDAAHYKTIRAAMLELGTGATTAGKYFRNLPVQVCAKTGTSQVTRVIDGRPQKINNGILISFAPANNPEIAVIAVGEGCKSSEPVMPTIADVYRYYFGAASQMELPAKENSLLG